LTNTNEAEAEIKARIFGGNKCYHAPGHLLKNYEHLSLKIGRLIMTYGAEL
jgi:hypothetical protein